MVGSSLQAVDQRREGGGRFFREKTKKLRTALTGWWCQGGRASPFCLLSMFHFTYSSTVQHLPVLLPLSGQQDDRLRVRRIRAKVSFVAASGQ